MSQIDRTKQVANTFRAHHRVEIIAEFLDLRQIVILGQQLCALQWRHSGINNDVRLEVKHTLYVTQRHVENQTQP